MKTTKLNMKASTSELVKIHEIVTEELNKELEGIFEKSEQPAAGFCEKCFDAFLKYDDDNIDCDCNKTAQGC